MSLILCFTMRLKHTKMNSKIISSSRIWPQPSASGFHLLHLHPSSTISVLALIQRLLHHLSFFWFLIGFRVLSSLISHIIIQVEGGYLIMAWYRRETIAVHYRQRWSRRLSTKLYKITVPIISHSFSTTPQRGRRNFTGLNLSVKKS
jgi:hypothetical protein